MFRFGARGVVGGEPISSSHDDCINLVMNAVLFNIFSKQLALPIKQAVTIYSISDPN